MKRYVLLIGTFLLLIAGFVLSDLFFGAEAPKEIKVAEKKKEIEYAKVEPLAKKQEEPALPRDGKPAERNVLPDNVSQDNVSKELKSENERIAGQDRESDRILIREGRRVKMAERRNYMDMRHQWRKALNEAYKEAKTSGDYSKYERLKLEEPQK